MVYNYDIYHFNRTFIMCKKIKSALLNLYLVYPQHTRTSCNLYLYLFFPRQC